MLVSTVKSAWSASSVPWSHVNDLSGDTNGITSLVDLCSIAENQDGCRNEEGRSRGDQHVRTNASRLVQQLPIEADKAARKRRHEGPPPRRRLNVRGALALKRPLQQQHHLRFIQKARPVQGIAGFG